MINPNVFQISKLVRQKCFDYAMSEQSSSYGFDNCFHGYETLGQMCAFASFVLYKTLLNRGFDNVKFCYGVFDNEATHCWVEYDDEFIIDITATQFGNYDEVYTTHTLDHKYSLEKYYKDIDELGWDYCCVSGCDELILDIQKELVYND